MQQFTTDIELERRVADLILRIEAEIRRVSLWSDEKPENRLLDSPLPFSYDTLTVEQWLQWIFLPRMRQILKNNLELPVKCAIHPYAEEFLTGHGEDTVQLLALIKQFDNLFA